MPNNHINTTVKFKKRIIQTVLLTMPRKAVELFVSHKIGQAAEKTSTELAFKDGVNFLQQHVSELRCTCKYSRHFIQVRVSYFNVSM